MQLNQLRQYNRVQSNLETANPHEENFYFFNSKYMKLVVLLSGECQLTTAFFLVMICMCIFYLRGSPVESSRTLKRNVEVLDLLKPLRGYHVLYLPFFTNLTFFILLPQAKYV